MINKDRIVPIMRIDLLSLIGTIMALANISFTVLAALDVAGNFAAGTGTLLCDQPVKSLNFTGASGTVYFVPAFDYEGIKVNGAAATIASGSAEVDTNVTGLYKAVLASGSVTITAVTPQ